MLIFHQITKLFGGKCACIKKLDMKWIEIALEYCTFTLISSLDRKRSNIQCKLWNCPPTPYSQARWRGGGGGKQKSCTEVVVFVQLWIQIQLTHEAATSLPAGIFNICFLLVGFRFCFLFSFSQIPSRYFQYLLFFTLQLLFFLTLPILCLFLSFSFNFPCVLLIFGNFLFR